ncbi:Uncharacterised protein [Enterobacter hormaechei]|nr:Uncharacterised protein [Enterobacter hormaechei]CZZ93799.1 Uncharacterised protein [Enterobacter hormaechei]SAB31388.1 Uncharacterised protein [Enterobacter hormaechei]SAB67909.1 Uncharacterised protein [Enterobacter hormaechei]SAD02501.1 Uncharacterised protein [Enterobacter hormaechei]
MQPFELPFSFNAFCDHRQLKRFGHFDDVGSHVLILQRVHKGFINLQGIDIKILQIAQAGVTRTKIINVDGMPGAPKRSDGRGADGRIGKAALGQFKGDLARVDAPFVEQLTQQARQLGGR